MQQLRAEEALAGVVSSDSSLTGIVQEIAYGRKDYSKVQTLYHSPQSTINYPLSCHTQA